MPGTGQALLKMPAKGLLIGRVSRSTSATFNQSHDPWNFNVHL
jgi:hypothetical protein